MAHWAASAGVGSAFAAGMAAAGISGMGVNPGMASAVRGIGTGALPPPGGVSIPGIEYVSVPNVNIKNDYTPSPLPKIEIPEPPKFSLASDPRYEEIGKNLADDAFRSVHGVMPYKP